MIYNMSGIELIAGIIVGGISLISSAAHAVYNRRKQNSILRKHDQLLAGLNDMKEQMKPRATPVPSPISTPSESNPYGEVVENPDDYQELKPFYNAKTGKTEYFVVALPSARPLNVPSLSLRK
jgi:hypothetical protein